MAMTRRQILLGTGAVMVVAAPAVVMDAQPFQPGRLL